MIGATYLFKMQKKKKNPNNFVHYTFDTTIMMIQYKNLYTFILTAIIEYNLYMSCSAQNTSTNPCETYARCGAYGACNAQASPICRCLQGFQPGSKEEWDSGNWTGGCVRRIPLKYCQGNGIKEDGFLRIRMVKVPNYQQHVFGAEDRCRGLCMINCSCIAYAHDNDLGCMFWNTTLLDIQQFHTGITSDLYFRVANSELGDYHNKHLKKILQVTVIVGVLLAFVCVFFFWKWMIWRRGPKRARAHGKEGIAPESDELTFPELLSKFNLEDLPLFEVEVLAAATNNFSDANKLGKGGFGPVYKGVLQNGREIAVKRLSRASGQGVQEFMNEVMVISKLQHRNLVRLLGCCLEDKEKMLIYEYLPNKSLDFVLFDQSNDILDWRRRFNIIEGTCRGLIYLHRDSRLRIIHRDLKPSNILLDIDWNPKISDFGMARIFGAKQDHFRTRRVVGTYGYMAPEYAIEGRFSEKSDVFSLGVLILEIVSGRKNTSFYNHDCSLNLLGHIWKLWVEGNISASVDDRISSSNYRTEVIRCIHIGLLCVQELPNERPSVSAVLSMLGSEITELPKPKQVAFAPAVFNRSHSDTGTSSQQSQKSSSSQNTITLTMENGR